MSTTFLSSESIFGSQKSGRFVVRLMVARSSFRLAYNVLRAGEVFYFGLSLHCLFVKNIAIKLNKFQP